MPVPLARAPREPPVTGLREGDRRRHEEADRADRVGAPHVLFGLRPGQAGQGREGGDVEEHGADQLDRRGPEPIRFGAQPNQRRPPARTTCM